MHALTYFIYLSKYTIYPFQKVMVFYSKAIFPFLSVFIYNTRNRNIRRGFNKIIFRKRCVI